MPTVERRREPRVAVQLPLRFTFAGKTIVTRIVDLSISGICFPTPQLLPVMTRMQMTLQLPEGRRSTPITLVGVVVRCVETRGRGKRPFDAAIFFEDVWPASARVRLQRFVEERLATA